MPISTTCAECGRSFQVRDELAGKRVKCPCGATFQVERPPEAVADPVPSAGAPGGPFSELFGESLPPPGEIPSFEDHAGSASGTPILRRPAPRKKSKMPLFLWGGGAALGVVGVVGVVVLIGVVGNLGVGGRARSERAKREEVRAKMREIHADDIAAVESVFGKIMKARLESDHESLFDLATTLEQDRLAGSAAFSAAVLAPMFPQLKEALAKHGIDDERLIPMQSVNFTNPNSLRLALMMRQAQLIKNLDDKRAFYLDVMPRVEAAAEEAADEIGPQVKELYAGMQQAAREAKLVEPLVMGDTVRATLTTRIRGIPAKCVITFKRVDEEWLLHTESVFNEVKASSAK